MTRIHLDLHYGADPDAVAQAYADPALYAAFADLPRTVPPEVVSVTPRGDDVVELRVRWRFSGTLSSAARRVIDPDKISWVEVSRHDLAARTVTFRMEPDNYADRFGCTGSYSFRSDPSGGGGAVRTIDGEVKVKAPLVGRAVEGAIVSGLEDQLQTEVAVVESFLG